MRTLYFSPPLRASPVGQILKTLVRMNVLCQLLLEVLLHFIGKLFTFLFIMFKHFLQFVHNLTNAPAKECYTNAFRTQSVGCKVTFPFLRPGVWQRGPELNDQQSAVRPPFAKVKAQHLEP